MFQPVAEWLALLTSEWEVLHSSLGLATYLSWNTHVGKAINVTRSTKQDCPWPNGSNRLVLWHLRRNSTNLFLSFFPYATSWISSILHLSWNFNSQDCITENKQSLYCNNIYSPVAPPPAPSQRGCFPSTARVILENGKSVTMSELQTWDKVQTGRDIAFTLVSKIMLLA